MSYSQVLYTFQVGYILMKGKNYVWQRYWKFSVSCHCRWDDRGSSITTCRGAGGSSGSMPKLRGKNLADFSLVSAVRLWVDETPPLRLLR
jgi:hypothetical protein